MRAVERGFEGAGMQDPTSGHATGHAAALNRLCPPPEVTLTGRRGSGEPLATGLPR